MNRFEGAPLEVIEFVNRVRKRHFEHLKNAAIMVIFDLKKRMANGHYVLARITRTNDLTKLLTASDLQPEGYDYFMYLDQAVWKKLNPADRTRLVRHELRHCIVTDSDRSPYGLYGHEIEDFYAELELNQDDPDWKRRLANIAAEVHAGDSPENQVEPETKDPRQKDLWGEETEIYNA